MRRKSERTATKKSKASPEKKVEKVKRTRARRSKKQSSSSENESAEDASPVPEAEPVPVAEVIPPTTPVKEESPEEAQDQVWRVKAAEGSGDTGEIQKLKICLTRPPTTPERPDRSPRSKRKHSRATSSSDGTPSGEAPEEKRKGKHRAKRSHRESKDESEKTQDSQDDEPESDLKSSQEPEKQPSSEATETEAEGKVDSSENTISTSNEETTGEKANVDSTEDSSTKGEPEKNEGKSEKDDKASDADTTVDSPKAETTVVSETSEPKIPIITETQDSQDSQAEDKIPEPESPTRRRSASVDKSEILELHPEENKVESDIETDKTKLEKSQRDAEDKDKVSKSQDKSPIEEPKSNNDNSINKTGVVASSENEKISRIMSTDSVKSQNEEKGNDKTNNEDNRKSLERSDSIQSNQEEPLHNGQAAPIVVSRKRRWGSRPSKISKQKSITISTDILKDIIPDVKPVEFEEVIEEKKHKRVVTERIERPVLPKIVIDNSENVQRAEQERNADRKDHEEKDIVKPRDMASSRKISIIKDNDSIITRPPSPPRHKQSCVLYITNLVRPFTLPQLKNLLQRTGRLVENGFWIDRIKSKCFVIYESEDYAVETRHALHGVTWPVSNPKTLQVDFSTQEAFDKAKMNEDSDNAQVSTIPGTVEDWLREQDMKRERGEPDKPWEKKLATREWDLGKNEKDKEKERVRREERPLLDKRRHRSPERSPEPARKFKKKEEEAPAKLLDDLFKKTKTTPCIYWLPLSAETIAIKEEQRRQHMAEHERRMQEQRRTHRRH